MTRALFESHLRSLPLLSRGKVRDNYAVGNDRILMVASDRISAFDVVMREPIPGKGETLTRMALFWFRKLAHVVPNHLTGIDPESVVTTGEAPQVRGRSMLVKRLNPLPIEAVVRGYLAGSGWKEYQQSGTVCGVVLPAGLQQAARLPQPIFTPATKAEAGAHDENITFAQVESLIGPQLASAIRHVALRLYEEAAAYALSRGIVIADTKFEFGLDASGTLTLMDEVLTPDSSRFWPVESYREGTSPPSYDKQYLRDWLETAQIKGQPWNKQAPAPKLSADVIAATRSRYLEAFAKLVEPPPEPPAPQPNLLSQLETLATKANTEEQRCVYRAQWAGAMVRFERIDIARAELQRLRALNVSFAAKLTAWILVSEGLLDYFESRSSDAISKFKRSHALAAAIGDVDLRSFSAAWLSAGELSTGDFPAAVSHALEAIEQRGANLVGLSRAHLVLADVLCEIGRDIDANPHYAKAREYAVDARDISMQCRVLYDLSAHRIARLGLEDSLGGDVSKRLEFAEMELNSAANLAQLLSLHSLSAMIPMVRGRLMLIKNNWEAANFEYAASESRGVLHGDPRGLAERAHAQAMMGLRNDAQTLAQRASALIDDSIPADAAAACYARLALTWRSLGDLISADACSEKAANYVAHYHEWQNIRRDSLLPLLGLV